MRRRVLALLGAALLIGVTAVPAAAGGQPEKFPVDLRVITYDAGFVCEFELRWEDLPQHSSTLVFPPDRNGDVIVRIVGQWSVRLTNLDDGVSREYGTGGQLKLVFHEDGSADVYSSGAVVAAYFVADLFGPSAWFFRGRLHDSLDASFVLIGHATVGSAEDVCAALMPPD
jgi:hypothetical protein